MRRPRIRRRRTFAAVVGGPGGRGRSRRSGSASCRPRSSAADGGRLPSRAAAGSTATVAKMTMTIEESLDGTIGYAGPREVIGNLAGTLTWRPGGGARSSSGAAACTRWTAGTGRACSTAIGRRGARSARTRPRRGRPPARAQPEGARLRPKGTNRSPLEQQDDPRRQALAEGHGLTRDGRSSSATSCSCPGRSA